MTNPNHYDEDWAPHPAATVLRTAGKFLTGLALAMLATTAAVAYVSARAGQRARARVQDAVEDIRREVRGAGDQIAQTAQAALDVAAGIEEPRGAATAV
jgi:hypothetical protein